MFKSVKMPFFSAEGGGGDADADVEIPVGKTFTQEDVDRIVGERLTREKAARADYDDLKEVAETLKDFGYEGSVSEVKALLKQQATERRKAAELRDLEEEADKTGTSPELLAEIKELKKELAEIKQDKLKQQKELEDKQKADDSFKEQVTVFNEKHPDVDVDKLSENKKFINFVQNSKPGLTLVDLYDNYIDLVGSAEAAAIEKIKANAERSTFSGKAKQEPSGGTHGLTERQQELAKGNGMTNKEYADLLKQVQ